MDKDKIKFLIDSISVLLGELADEVKKDDSSIKCKNEKKKKKKKKNQKIDETESEGYDIDKDTLDIPYIDYMQVKNYKNLRKHYIDYHEEE